MDVDPQLMSWIGVSEAACLEHDRADGSIANECIGTLVVSEDAEGVFRRNAKVVRSTENRDYCIDKIEYGMSQSVKLADKKVLFGFVVAESDGHCSDHGLGMVDRDVVMIDDMHGVTVENEVLSDESKRASCPCTSVNRGRYGVKTYSFSETRLAIFA